VPIKLACELNLSDAPRCQAPECNVGILPYAKNEPFAVDADGRPYCRKHGDIADPAYSARLAAYRVEVKAERMAGLKLLDEATEGEKK
jgi:hypothetical protein